MDGPGLPLLWGLTSLGHPAEGQNSAQGGVCTCCGCGQSRWSHMSCDKPSLNCRRACSLRARLGQDSHGSYCTGFVPHLDWELPIPETNLLQERKDIFSLPSVQLQWESGFIFLKIKPPKETKQKCQKLCALIDQLQCDTSSAGSVFTFPPTPYIAILSTRVICEDGDREKIPTGSACHCEGEGITVFYQILNSLICWG